MSVFAPSRASIVLLSRSTMRLLSLRMCELAPTLAYFVGDQFRGGLRSTTPLTSHTTILYIWLSQINPHRVNKEKAHAHIDIFIPLSQMGSTFRPRQGTEEARKIHTLLDAILGGYTLATWIEYFARHAEVVTEHIRYFIDCARTFHEGEKYHRLLDKIRGAHFCGSDELIFEERASPRFEGQTSPLLRSEGTVVKTLYARLERKHTRDYETARRQRERRDNEERDIKLILLLINARIQARVTKACAKV